MVRNPKKLIDEGVVIPSEFTKVQQNGIDCSLRDELILEPGTSKNVFLNEGVRLPANLCGELRIRSTYSRLGVFLSSGLYDSGFYGQLGSTFYNLGSTVVVIPANERVCQFICHEAESASLYTGKYQGT